MGWGWGSDLLLPEMRDVQLDDWKVIVKKTVKVSVGSEMQFVELSAWVSNIYFLSYLGTRPLFREKNAE